MSSEPRLTTGTSLFVNELATVQPQGPIAYTTYDFLKHFAGMISIIKFVAHVFSLPLMVFLRKDLGIRYVDPIHISLSFIIWQVAGMFSLGAGVLLSEMASPLISVVAWLFVPVALWHRHKAKQAALRRERYSYDPGVSHLAHLAVRLPFIRNRAPEAVPAFVRRWFDPAVVFVLGILCAVLGISTGFGLFLVWTAVLLYVDAMLSERGQFELYLDMVDAQVIAEAKQRMLAGEPAGASGFSVASVADVKGLTQAAR